ncbi:hypothetical protein AYI69_g8966 [Smittium culicis]|uniref:Endonuclease/exonuclease/phosphatase domain-containing protein n=1 Tax=Smittium culicis TaxID=133412 RepID=A0A1R1XG24_9FUNG|nr:hypothetical protein AYI69_g8966 [Smittium culicis]
MIDHIYYAGLNSRPSWCTSNSYLDLSDHMMITAQWSLDALEVPAKKVKINVKKLLLTENNFVSYNQFTVLAESEMGQNKLCRGLIDIVWDLSARVGELDVPGETINTVLSNITLKKIKKRRIKFRKLTKNNCSISKYSRAKSNADRSIKADRKAQHAKRLKKIADQILNNDSKSYWRYIKAYTGKSFQSIADCPVYDKNKNSITEKDEKNEKNEKIKIWTNNFGELTKDTTGNSRTTDKW